MIYKEYVLHLSSVYGIQCLGEIYNSSVASKFFTRTHSIIVRICVIVERFLGNFSDSEVAFLEEEKDVTLCPFLY